MFLKRLFKISLLLFILIGLGMCAYPVLHNDLGYNTDIARDFLILQDAVTTHKLPLIGPRTGGIDGLFHGPLWTWINLPVFIFSHGNPVATGWFWIFLIICLLLIVFYVSTKVFNKYVGLLSALVLSFALVGNSSSFLNPFGAVLISPLFLYFFYKYINSLKIIYLLLTFLAIGLMIQFEVAFGGPMLVLTIVYLLFFLFKTKKMSHFLSIFILLIPLSTYILFDLRHNFLQLKSILGHIGSPTGNGRETFIEILQNRKDGILHTIMSIPYAPLLICLLVIAFFIYIALKSYKNKNLKYRQFYLLFTYFYFGYWPLSFYLNGDVQSYHVQPFLPMAIIVLCSSYLVVRREIFAVIFLIILYFNFTYDSAILSGFASFSSNSPGSWLFNYHLAQRVFSLAPKEFGYYVFTADELGYGPKYAITYVNRQNPNKIVYPYIKKHITFIVLAPVNGGDNNNRTWWVKNKVKINKEPITAIDYPNGYRIEEYSLTDDEVKVPSDPNLMSGLFYR